MGGGTKTNSTTIASSDGKTGTKINSTYGACSDGRSVTNIGNKHGAKGGKGNG